MPQPTKSTVIINWDAILQPRSGSPRQHLATLFSFAKLYSYQWQSWLKTLPAWVEDKARTALAAAYLPHICKLYLSPDLSRLIDQLKQGVVSENQFFETLRDTYFSFLTKVDGIDPIKCVKDAWLNPRIQPLTAREEKRVQKLLQEFDQIILIANTNIPDIEAFIRNLLTSSMLEDHLLLASTVLVELQTYRREGGVPEASELLALLSKLGEKFRMVTSVRTGEWKVQTGSLARETKSSGFLPKLLEVIKGPITVLSEAPADLNMARKQNVSAMTGYQYFNDTSALQYYGTKLYDNWPITAVATLAIFIIALALLAFMR